MPNDQLSKRMDYLIEQCKDAGLIPGTSNFQACMSLDNLVPVWQDKKQTHWELEFKRPPGDFKEQ